MADVLSEIGDSRAGGADCAHGRGARRGRERLATVVVVGVQMDRHRACLYGRQRLGGKLRRGPRERGMVAVAVERYLKEGHRAEAGYGNRTH